MHSTELKVSLIATFLITIGIKSTFVTARTIKVHIANEITSVRKKNIIRITYFVWIIKPNYVITICRRERS